MDLSSNSLDIEDDLCHVLNDARYSGKLVADTINLD